MAISSKYIIFYSVAIDYLLSTGVDKMSKSSRTSRKAAEREGESCLGKSTEVTPLEIRKRMNIVRNQLSAFPIPDHKIKDCLLLNALDHVKTFRDLLAEYTTN